MRDEGERSGRPQPGHERARVPPQLGGALDRIQLRNGTYVVDTVGSKVNRGHT